MQVSGTESEVCKDIEARQRLGINKYGRTVAEQDYKLVEWLEHAYHEALDQAIYLKRSIEEIKATEVSQAEVVRPKAEPGAAACSSAVVQRQPAPVGGTLRITESRRKNMTTPNGAERDFGTSDCSSAFQSIAQALDQVGSR